MEKIEDALGRAVAELLASRSACECLCLKARIVALHSAQGFAFCNPQGWLSLSIFGVKLVMVPRWARKQAE